MTLYVEFLEGKKHGGKNAEVSDNHESFKDCGRLLTDNDLVVDIDSMPRSAIEKMIQIFNIKTELVWTSRGAHLYFKKPQSWRGANAVCPLGFKVEYKHSGNTKAVTIKQNGVMRRIDNEGFREDLPDCFKIIRGIQDLVGYDEGDGRNQALHAHKFKVMKLSNYKNMLRFINSNVFATPLDTEELETVIRDEKMKAEKDGEYDLAMALIQKYKIVKLGKSLLYYDGVRYINNEDALTYMITQECAGQPTRYIKEVRDQIMFNLRAVDETKAFDIKLSNGILRDGMFISVDSAEFTPYYIDIDYRVDAEPVEAVDGYLNHLTDGDDNYKRLLMEVLAHTLITDAEFKRQLAKFFIFIGGGGNGKGTLLEIIRIILGRHNCTSLPPKRMTDERYLYTMKGRLANLGDDVDGEPINNDQMKILKNISTCDEIPLRKMREQSEDVVLTASLIFTSNHLLKSFEKGESYKRRVMWLPMFSTVTKKEKNFISNLTTPEALEYWMKLIVDGYVRLYQNHEFTESEKVEKYNELYHLENNGTTIFVNDYQKEYFIGKTNNDVYEVFEQWAKENDVTGTKKMLKEEISKTHDLEIRATKVNGKTYHVYRKIGCDDGVSISKIVLQNVKKRSS